MLHTPSVQGCLAVAGRVLFTAPRILAVLGWGGGVDGQLGHGEREGVWGGDEGAGNQGIMPMKYHVSDRFLEGYLSQIDKGLHFRRGVTLQTADILQDIRDKLSV